MEAQNNRLKNVFLLVLLALCWGPSFFFIKIALREWSPFTIVSVRLSFAALILYLIVKFQRRSLWQWRHLWHRFAFMGFFASALPFVLITYSEKWISSSLAGIINGSPPIFTAFLAHFFIDSEKLSWRRIIGLLIGVSGLVTVFLPTLLDSVVGNGWGVSFVAIASFCYAIGMVYSRKYLMELPPMIGPTNQVLYGAIMTIPFMFIFDNPTVELANPAAATMLSMLGLSFFGTVMAFVLYYAILRLAGATYLSTATLLFPFVSIFMGVIFLKEELGWNAYLGCGLILIGLIIANKLLSTKDFTQIFGKRKI